MRRSKHNIRRRDLIVGTGALSLAAALPSADASNGRAQSNAPQVAASGVERATEATAEQVVNALESTYGVQRGMRRNHTKGIGVLGSFTGTAAAAAYSCSPIFSEESLQIVGRFSLAGGDPTASDTEKSARGLGLQFRLPNGGLHHMTMLSTPMFFAAMPKTFLDKFLALIPDPVTGKSDPAKWQAFVSSHPDTFAQFHYLDAVNPPPSYANCAFYSIHTFRFVGPHGKVTKVRWRFVPQDGELQLPTAQMITMPRDFLNQTLIDRTRRGPSRWDMIVTLGEEQDSEIDPTIVWPPGREEIRAGTLEIFSADPEESAGSYHINFDPLLMGEGITASADPVLLFRSPSYGTSFTRRIRNL